MENQRGIFFSADIMIRFGEASGMVNDSNWQTEISKTRPEQVPSPEQLAKLQQTLAQLHPKFVATGHGPCLRV